MSDEVNGHANGHDEEDDGSPALSKFMRTHFDLKSWSGPIDLHWKPSTENPPALPPAPPTTPPETTAGKALKAMLDAGMTPDEIGRILSLPAEDSTRFPPVPSTRADVIAKRREWDREYRRRKKAEAKQSTPLPPADANSTTSLSFSLPSEEYEEKKEKTGDTRARAHPLPDDWAPTPKHFELGQSLGHSQQDVMAFAADMRDWAKANAGRAVSKKTDWNAAFNNWIRRQRRPTNARPGPGLPNSPRKENGAQRAYRLKHEAIARQSGGGLSNSAEGVVELDPSEWSTGNQARTHDH